MTYAQHFEYATRPNGTGYWRLRDDAPDWLADAIYVAHDDELPNDWRYTTAYGIVRHLDESDNPATEGDFEYAESAATPYTEDLLLWYADNLNRLGYADENAREFGPGESLGHTLLCGQEFCIAAMFRVIADAYLHHEVEE